MSKVAVVYWSQTGNTEAMAKIVAEAAGTEPIECSEFSADKVKEYDALAFGCPAMGDEELDPDFQDLWESCLPELGDRPVGLFGSYDWGAGDWMDLWRQGAEDSGANVVDAVIGRLYPDDDTASELSALGKKLAG